jgi:hypothetical protein
VLFDFIGLFLNSAQNADSDLWDRDPACSILETIEDNIFQNYGEVHL